MRPRLQLIDRFLIHLVLGQKQGKDSVLPLCQQAPSVDAGETDKRAAGCLHTENAVLKEKLGKKRILLNDDQRRRLAVKRTILGRKRLRQYLFDHLH